MKSLSLMAAGAVVLVVPAFLAAQSSTDAGVATVNATVTEAGVQNTAGDVQAHVLRALDFFRAKQYAAAIKEFEEANALSPSADFVFNIARANELLADEIAQRSSADPRATAQELIRYYSAAVTAYEKYLRDKVDPPDGATVRRKIEELRVLVSRNQEALRRQEHSTGIQFRVEPAGAAVFLDETRVTTPAGQMVEAQPGVHRIRVTAQDFLEWNAQVRVRPGETAIATAALTAATRFRTVSGQHLASYIIGGVGLATFLGGAGVGIYAATMQPDPFDCGSQGGCPRHSTAVASDVLMGIGTVIAVAAVVTYFVEAGGSRTERITTPPMRPPVDESAAPLTARDQ